MRTSHLFGFKLQASGCKFQLLSAACSLQLVAIICSKTKDGEKERLIYGHFASIRLQVSGFKSQVSVACSLLLVAIDNAICTGDCPRVLAREKHGNARSAHSPCGGISMRLTICS